jgi:lipid A 3-O-deacylase
VTHNLKIIILVFAPLVTKGQMVDNTSAYRNVAAKSFVRLNYENDYFSKNDIYYTQGINIEFTNAALARNPLSKLLWKFGEIKYGFAAEHLGFTPTSISHNEVLTGDRPFAACLFFKTFSISNDVEKSMHLSSTLTTGVIGPAAGGKEFQSAIHRWINDTQPLGWTNQIRNDLILNYEIVLEKKLSAMEHILLSIKSGIKAGTLSDKIFGGASLMTGWFDDPYRFFSDQSSRKFQLLIYVEPQLRVIGYDATLQGGLINRQSPYKIRGENISRFVIQYHSGLAITIRKFRVEYFQSYISKEFAGSKNHHWGGVRIAIAFR